MAHNDPHMFAITLWPLPVYTHAHVHTHAHTNTPSSFDSVNMQAQISV